jgi:hypothetical protein
MGVTGVLPGAQVHREAISREKIVVEKGLAVNLVRRIQLVVATVS